jgi:hypothetical protein
MKKTVLTYLCCLMVNFALLIIIWFYEMLGRARYSLQQLLYFFLVIFALTPLILLLYWLTKSTDSPKNVLPEEGIVFSYHPRMGKMEGHVNRRHTRIHQSRDIPIRDNERSVYRQGRNRRQRSLTIDRGGFQLLNRRI